MAVSGVHKRISGFTLQLLGGLDGAVDPPLDRVQGVDAWPRGTRHFAFADLISDLKVGAPFGLLEQSGGALAQKQAELLELTDAVELGKSWSLIETQVKTGISAPVISDDPVSSLDPRRIKEVAKRIARLADQNQVIVFTHDILFATTLLRDPRFSAPTSQRQWLESLAPLVTPDLLAGFKYTEPQARPRGKVTSLAELHPASDFEVTYSSGLRIRLTLVPMGENWLVASVDPVTDPLPHGSDV